VFAFSSHLTPAGFSARNSFAVISVLAAVLATALSGLLSAVPAYAETTGSCPSATLSQPFSKWGDANYYSLVSEGSFEGTVAGWSQLGGAKKVTGSESYGVTGSAGSYSVLLPQGATAQSPFMCVTEVNRSFRLFARSEGSSSTLKAEVVYKTSTGGTLSASVGTVNASSAWNPTPILKTGVAKAISSNGTAQLALRFTSTTGSTRIDDVYLDPRMR
jgi:hypothetical protein